MIREIIWKTGSRRCKLFTVLAIFFPRKTLTQNMLITYALLQNSNALSVTRKKTVHLVNLSDSKSGVRYDDKNLNIFMDKYEEGDVNTISFIN